MTDKPKYYECGICGAWHRAEWDGDCREDDERLNPEDMDARHGSFGWESIEMPT